MNWPLLFSVPAISHAARPSCTALNLELPMRALPFKNPVEDHTPTARQDITQSGMQMTKGSQRKSHMTLETTMSPLMLRGGTFIRYDSGLSHARHNGGKMCVTKRFSRS